ncbi:sarcospan [Scyliorhinus canicula]|uniref:sarcospan n=1 Tax=Scyliorhinus canicula TaxID=7830 RepID=UPI0018F2BE1D|nr:sarcospan [Scyliorhinus canicula]
MGKVHRNGEKQDKAGEKENTEPGKEADKAAERKAGAQAAGDEDSHKCCGCRFPVLIALLQLVLSVGIVVIAFIMKSISSSLLARDTPYWVGIIICLASLLGFYMYCITYQVDEKTSLQFIIKLLYFLLCALGLILCISAVAFAAHHFNQITTFTCQMNEEQCICKQDPDDHIARTFQYNDVSDCESVTSTIKLYLLVQIILNLILAIVCLLGCYVMWKHRYQVFFVGLNYHPFKTSQQQPKV